MPKWIHERAEHILAKNPSMPKGEAFAISTQQAHATGKSPTGYGTSRGRRDAKTKFDTPKDDVKMANPGGLTSPKMDKTALGLLSEIPGTEGVHLPGFRRMLEAAKRVGSSSAPVEAAKRVGSSGAAVRLPRTRDQVMAARLAAWRPTPAASAKVAEAFGDELAKIGFSGISVSPQGFRSAAL